jgi:hypothetical protein
MATIPSREVLIEELTKLYEDEGEDALLARCVEVAGGADVMVHTVRGTTEVCVHLGNTAEHGVIGPTLADTLVMALLNEYERKRELNEPAE